jgi:hypothetical protein
VGDWPVSHRRLLINAHQLGICGRSSNRKTFIDPRATDLAWPPQPTVMIRRSIPYDDFNLLIGGRLVPGAATIPVINPATEHVLADAPRASLTQLNDAVAADKGLGRVFINCRGWSASSMSAVPLTAAQKRAVTTPSETSVVQKQEHALRGFLCLVDDLVVRRLALPSNASSKIPAFNSPANTSAAVCLSRTIHPARSAHRSR